MPGGQFYNYVTFKLPGAGSGSTGGGLFDGGDGSGPNFAEAMKNRIALTLESPWEYEAGLKPNVNRAIVPYREFDKLGKVIDQVGSIEFWFETQPGSGDPAVKLDGWRLVDVEGVRPGYTIEDLSSVPGGVSDPVASGLTMRFLEYRLFFSDFREKYVWPRGGRLELGLLNLPDPPKGTDSDAGSGGSFGEDDGDDATAGGSFGDGVPEKGLDQLIRSCLIAMGVADTTVPAGVDLLEAPRDLKWLGNHAPTELAKLLDMAGCAFCPTFDGKGRVKKITTDGDPTITAYTVLPPLKLPSIDRRGKTVVFTSYPNANVKTLSLVGPRKDKWYFVTQDSKGEWLHEDDNDLLSFTSLSEQFKSDFADISTDFRQRMRDQAYKFIKLGVGNDAPSGTNPIDVMKLPPSGIQPILTRQFGLKGDLEDVLVVARSAYYDPDNKNFTNADAKPIKVPALFKNDDNVIQLLSALVRVSPDPSTDLRKDMVEMQSGQFTVKFTIPHYILQPDGITWLPDFFHIGFQRQPVDKDGNTLRQLTDSELKLIINPSVGGQTETVDDRDIVFISRPDFRLRIGDEGPANLQQITNQAKSLADRLLADSSQPTRMYLCVGFGSTEIDGLVSKIVWDQGPMFGDIGPSTTITVNNWYRPGGPLEGSESSWQAGGSYASDAGGQYPKQDATQAQRTALGEPGATQPSIPLNPLQGVPDVTPCISGQSGTPASLGSSQGGDTATWNRDMPNNAGATVLVGTGVYWNTSTGELTQNIRVHTYDACGNLYSIGPELTRVIDTGEDCG